MLSSQGQRCIRLRSRMSSSVAATTTTTTTTSEHAAAAATTTTSWSTTRRAACHSLYAPTQMTPVIRIHRSISSSIVCRPQQPQPQQWRRRLATATKIRGKTRAAATTTSTASSVVAPCATITTSATTEEEERGGASSSSLLPPMPDQPDAEASTHTTTGISSSLLPPPPPLTNSKTAESSSSSSSLSPSSSAKKNTKASSRSLPPPLVVLKQRYDQLQKSANNQMVVIQSTKVVQETNHNDDNVDDTDDIQHGGRRPSVWWTSTITCPITGHRARSGRRLTNNTSQQQDKANANNNNNNNNNDEQSEVLRNNGVVLHGNVCFRKRRQAEHAAAAKFLDDLDVTQATITTTTGGRGHGSKEQRRCIEEPIVIQDYDKYNAQLNVSSRDDDAVIDEQQQQPQLQQKPQQQMQAPTHVLWNEYTRLGYNKHYSFAQMKRGFQVSKRRQAAEREGRGLFTATYTCFVTGYTVKAGTVFSARRAPFVSDDGAIFYADVKSAKHAAAARFIDLFEFAKSGGQTEEPDAAVRLCEELPMHVDELSELVERRKSHTLSSPRLLLRDIYEKKGMEVKFETQRLETGGHASVFTCPISGHVVQSGAMIRNPDHYRRADDGSVTCISVLLAELAVAARFLDDLHYTQTRQVTPRWCHEEPTLINGEGIEAIYFDLDSGTYKGYVHSLEARGMEDDKVETAETTTPRPPSSTTEADQSTEKVEALSRDHFVEGDALQAPVESDTEEELVIRTISSSVTSPGTSTLDRIMEAWGENVSTQQGLLKDNADSSTSYSIQMSLAQQKEKVIADTVAWCDRLRKQHASTSKGHSVFQTTTSPMTVKSATAALRTLANAHWNHPSADMETNRRVEAAAMKMIMLLRDVGSPNVDAYNSYLKCLCRSSPQETAQAATFLLRAMVEQNEVDGHILPEPDIGTFNTVAQLCALIGGSEGHEKCESVFDSILEEDKHGRNVKANRDTFLVMLSSLARPSSESGTSYFDREKAQKWIERMQQFAKDLDDDTLITAVDTEAFNAPLRWSGGREASRTRPFSQALPWDKHSEAFGKGFHPLQEDKPLWIEARRIEEWLLEMETIGPSPNAETYEAAIQAWTRTGTADGLRRAELVALRALASDSVHPRFQTFHPIIAAWAYSGDERALEKVQEWVERVESGGTSHAEMKHDERIYLAKAIARRTLQTQLLSGVVDNAAIDKVTEYAECCTSDLGLVVDMSKANGLLLDPAMFLHAVSAWGELALAKGATSPSDDSVNEMEIAAMMNVVKQFDETVHHFRMKQSVDSANDNDALYSQVQQLMKDSQTIYLSALSYLNQVDRQNDTAAQSSAFYKYIFAAEGMLRRSEELRLILDSQLSSLRKANKSVMFSPDDIAMTHDDLYTYPPNVSDASFGKSHLEKQVALYEAIVDGCAAQLKTSDCFADSVRLCMLVVDFMNHVKSLGSSISSPHTTACDDAVDCTDLYLGILSVLEAIPNEGERHVALRRAFLSVSAISDGDGKGEDNNTKQQCRSLIVDKRSILSAMKNKPSPPPSVAESTLPPGKKKAVRPRRLVRRQRWRNARQATYAGTKPV